MKKPIFLLYCLIFFLVGSSCSKEDNRLENKTVIGTWELTTWTIHVEMDLNNDSLFSTNLLDEANCLNYETLIFDANGTYSSHMTFNPSVDISLVDGSTESYIIEVECDAEGIIGLAGSYNQNGNLVSLFNQTAIINGNQLSIVYQNAVDIYNEDFTEVIATKDLTLIYSRK